MEDVARLDEGRLPVREEHHQEYAWPDCPSPSGDAPSAFRQLPQLLYLLSYTERLLKYSKKKRDAEDFRRKTVAKGFTGTGRRKAITLKEFVTEKKMKMLTESSQHESE